MVLLVLPELIECGVGWLVFAKSRWQEQELGLSMRMELSPEAHKTMAIWVVRPCTGQVGGHLAFVQAGSGVSGHGLTICSLAA